MEIQEILGYQLGTSSRLIKRTMESSLTNYDITTPQWSVLKLLNTREQLTQSQIANELVGDKATVGEVILRLSEKGYIEKSFHDHDRRVHLIRLTAKAKEAVKNIEKMVPDITEKALQGFSEEDRELLHKFLNQIIDNLKGE